jgi:hypothetical protein
VPPEPDAFTGLARRQPDNYRSWTRRQVRAADSWQHRRDQPVSVALSPVACRLSPVGDRLALSVGQRLSVLDTTGSPHVTHRGGPRAGTWPHHHLRERQGPAAR